MSSAVRRRAGSSTLKSKYSDDLRDPNLKRVVYVMEWWMKLLRARGGCLGVKGRRRTWHDCDKPRLAV